jgi:hypothetical protein
MLVTIEGNRQNRNHAFALAGAERVTVIRLFSHRYIRLVCPSIEPA